MVQVISQAPLLLLSSLWLLTLTSIKKTPFQKSVYKVARFQVHAISHKMRKDSLEGSLYRVLLAVEFEFQRY